MVNEHLTEEARAALANAQGNAGVKAPDYSNDLADRVQRGARSAREIAFDLVLDELRTKRDEIIDMIAKLEMARDN